MSNKILEVSNLNKSYGSLKAVDNLSFSVNEGEIFGFLGPNGAGKTTTINIICGLIKMTSGEIKVKGISLKDNPKELRSMFGVCPQNIVIWKDLTVWEQIDFMGRMFNVPSVNIKNTGKKLLEELGLSEKKNKLAKTLSGGMQRRLNIILALIHDPEIVILDEPEAGLDPQSRVLVRNYIKSLGSRKTVILTSHNMDEVEKTADKVAIIDRGKLLINDTTENILNSGKDGNILEFSVNNMNHGISKNISAKLTEDGYKLSSIDNRISISGEKILENISVIIEMVKKEKYEVSDINFRKKTLEDVFISLTGRGLRE